MLLAPSLVAALDVGPKSPPLSLSLRRRSSWALIWRVLKYSIYIFILKILATGPMPNHVAFIMDGNRRYARKNGKPVVQGHVEGANTFLRILAMCIFLKINCVSAYMFSIENFNRPEKEVSALMDLARQKLSEITQHGGFAETFGVRLNIVGNLNLLPEVVQEDLRRAEELTQHNTNVIVNVHVPYTSRNEMATAVTSCVRDSMQDNSVTTKISEKDIDSQLMTSLAGSPPLDILVRTSGVKRLSDYLLWQCCEYTQIQCCETNWPEFGLFDFIPMILDFQLKVWERGNK